MTFAVFFSQITKRSYQLLHFYGFLSVRHVSDAMSFLIFNGQTRKLFDIVENRQLPCLERYFNRYPLSVRENVQIEKIQRILSSGFDTIL